MSPIKCKHSLAVTIICCFWPVLTQAQQPAHAKQEELPNILWLTSEDNSPLLGCYGDALATTPNLDRLAGEGFLYTRAYANAPVCAPSRNTIITGVYANSAGNENMRSYYPKSAIVRLLPEYLRNIGYYCTNNDKKDYNFAGIKDEEVWDESSKTAHYKNRKPGQPFFAVFNTLISHESCLHRKDSSTPKHDADKIDLPPYQPDTKAIRTDWARYYDYIEKMDAWVGEKLKELDEAGLSENTIVIYYGDHGGVLPRSKRFVYETGTRVPLIVRIPEKFKKLYPAARGSRIDRLVSLVDLTPTMLSISGVSLPEYLQGSAFLGPQQSKDPRYVYMFRGRMDERIDMSRAVRDKKYRYIRNYMPYRIYAQHIDYLWKAPSMRSWEEMYVRGECNEVQSRFFQTKPVEELFDTENDPWEVNNLAGDPAYRKELLRMRNENTRWMREIHDAGFIPEGAILKKITENQSLYDYMHSGKQSVDELIAISDLAGFATTKEVPRLTTLLKSENELNRYWAACGLLQLADKARPAIPGLKAALADSFPDVAITAAEALYKMGYQKEGLRVLLEALKSKDIMVQLRALNTIDNSCRRGESIIRAVSDVLVKQKDKPNINITNISTWILNKP